MLKIRVDDFPFTKQEERWRHNIDNFKKFDEVMARHITEYVLGVIPKHTTREDLDYLSSNPRIDVAIHGIEHDERFPNEFREWQTEKDIGQAIGSVKSLWDPLVGPIDSYIPPHNVIDQKTVRALINSGFENLHTGPGSDFEVMKYAAEQGLNIRPSSSPDFYGRSDEMMNRDSVSQIKMLCQQYDSEFCWLTLHWTWELSIGLESLDKFLTEIYRK